MAVQRTDWDGLVSGRTDPVGGLYVDMPVQPSARGGSGTFLAKCSDRELWWIKPPNHLQNGKVIVTEFIVGRLGALIGAPTCEVSVIEIPDAVVGWEFRPGHQLVKGFGSGSRTVQDALEVNALEARDRDNNRVRHAGVFAMYDWCWGGDDQWLTAETRDRMLFSHDHGWYLPENGPDWSEATLTARVDEPHPTAHPVAGLDRAELERLADRLETVTRQEVAAVLVDVPMSWPVTHAELACLGFFLERRAPSVATRLRSLAAGLP